VRFALALVVGMALALILGAAFGSLDQTRGMIAWLSVNLGLSAPLFAVLTIMGWNYLESLKQALNADTKAEAQIAHLEQRIDLVVALLFGVGVLYTAVGLRGALVQAIDGPSEQSASGMLAALVNGGILSAMTSTVVGGVLGYGLRMLKLFRVGHALELYYSEQAIKSVERREDLLKEILSELKQAKPNHGD
jgi:hypothetical protein